MEFWGWFGHFLTVAVNWEINLNNRKYTTKQILRLLLDYPKDTLFCQMTTPPLNG